MNIQPKDRPAWEALQDALKDTVPECDGEVLYVVDDLDQNTKDYLAGICADCPVLDLCRTYAATAKPIGGWWPHNLPVRIGLRA